MQRREPRYTSVVRGVEGTERLDRVLRAAFPHWGRQTVQRIIQAREVTVNDKTVWLASWQVKNGDRIGILVDPAAKSVVPTRFDPSWIIADEPHWLVVDKPAGLLSHSTRWTDAPGLLELAQAAFGDLALFHRLDRDTSGLVLLSRTAEANRYLDRLFQERLVEKEYLAVVALPNRLAPRGEIRLPLAPDPKRRDRMRVVDKGGASALTRYELLDVHDDHQLVRCWPVTGRTHQLRVHLAALGAAVVGDRLYAGATRPEQRLMLHARGLTLPALNEWPLRVFTAPLPVEFEPFIASAGFRT